MSDERKNKLIDLGTDVLAEALLKLAGFGEHGGYHVWLNQVHGKKSSFWRHYRGE